jgi:hypothetical protein
MKINEIVGQQTFADEVFIHFEYNVEFEEKGFVKDKLNKELNKFVGSYDGRDVQCIAITDKNDDTYKKFKLTFKLAASDKLWISEKSDMERVRTIVEQWMTTKISFLKYASVKPFDISIFLYNGLPRKKIFAPTVILKIRDKITLTNIDKLLQCEKLQIQDPEKITGNVLGVLKIKGLTNLSILDFYRDVSWANLLIKYVHNKTFDIIACQEELIEAGLKDYAKL